MAKTYTLTDAVHIDIRVDNQDISGDFGPGDVALPDAIAEILVAQGHATPTVKGGKKAAASAPVIEEASITETPEA